MAKYRKEFARKKIKVNGKVVEVLILGPRAEIPIDPDLSSEMDRVAAQMAYWGSIVAAAEKEEMECDASYRRFRAQITQQVLAKDPKLSEWKVKAKIEATAGFSQFKSACAQAKENLTLCERMFRAFDKKGNVLQSKGAYIRDVLNKQGIKTAKEPRGWNLSGKGSDKDDDVPSSEKPKKKKKKKRRAVNGD